MDSRGRGTAYLALALIGILGGLAHAFAAPIVVATRDQSFAGLFRGAVLIAFWLLGTAAFSVRRVGSAPSLDAASSSAATQ